MAPTLGSRIPSGMAAALRGLGLSYREVLARAGLPEHHLESPGETVTVPEYFALWDAIRAASGDAGVGLALARVVELDVSEPLFLALASSRSVRDAVDVLARYKRMLSAERVEVHTDSRGELTLYYCWPLPEHTPPQALLDAELAFLIELCRRSTKTPELAPTELFLRARSLPPEGGHAQYFRCPIRFDSERNGLRFSAHTVALPFVTHNPRMLAALLPYLAEQLPPEPPGIPARVSALLATRMRGRRVTVRAIGKELGMSERALQRALHESGTSFRALLDSVRNEHARRYLAQPRLSEGEVAFLLGFEDPNSFSRAFRTWNGLTPTEFRKGQG